jgi:cytochrome c553
VICAASLVGASFAEAGPTFDPQAELWAASCAACHGAGGAGVGGFPPLAGRDAKTLLALLLQQRAGQADTTIMHQYAKGFSEAELARIATVLSAQPKP